MKVYTLRSSRDSSLWTSYRPAWTSATCTWVSSDLPVHEGEVLGDGVEHAVELVVDAVEAGLHLHS